MRYVTALPIVLICLLGVAGSALATGLVVLDQPAVVSSQEVRQDLNRALLAVVMKIRGRSAADLADLGVALSEVASKHLPDKSTLLAPFSLKETRISALLSGSNTELGGGRVAGTFVFEDDFLRQVELAFALDYQIETGSEAIQIHGAGIGEKSPMPPLVSLYVVAAKDMPDNFDSHFHSWQDIYSFAVLKGLDLADPARLPKGSVKYVVFQFVHSRVPAGDGITALISNRAEGQNGEKGQTKVNTFDGWKIFRHWVEMNLASKTPLFFKTRYHPRHTGVKDIDGRTHTIATFTPHMGGGMVGKVRNTTIDLAGVVEDAKASPKAVDPPGGSLKKTPDKPNLVNVALNRPTLVIATGRYSKSKDRTKAGAGAVDGKRTSDYGFHSDKLKNPWWQVDLGKGATVHKFRIINRSCCADRAKTMRILLSMDGQSWDEVHDQGGKTFRTLKISINPKPARYVRLQLAEANYFHLQEVEVLGQRGTPTASPASADSEINRAGMDAGILDGHWSSPEWKAKMDFWTQNGSALAYYRTANDRGWLWMKKENGGYQGYWTETASNQRCATRRGGSYHWGRVTLVNSDGELSGLWSYCEKPASRKWTAHKKASLQKLHQKPQWNLFRPGP